MEWGFGFFKIKEESRVMYETCMKRAASIGRADYIRTKGVVDLAEIFKQDMLRFLVYLAYADGRIGKEEVRYINLLLGYQMYDFMIDKYAEDAGLKTESILDSPPASLEPFVRSNIGPETGEISNQYYDIISLYVTTFNYIGNDFIACSDNIRQGEIEALSSYINMLRRSIYEVNDKIAEYKPTIKFERGAAPSEEYRIEAPDYYANKWSGDGQSDSTNMDGRTRITDKDRSLRQEESVETQHKEQKETLHSEQIDSDREKSIKETISDESSLEKLMEELNGLTGMESVKQEVNNLVNLVKICQIRKEKGLQIPPTTNHLVFLGNPGTGKTTVARILGKIFYGLGVLSKGQLIEVDRSGLVAGYMGQTGEKVMEVVEKAKGGVLFIDEAYALASNKTEGDFGQEAIDILNKAMEDYKDDLVVIAAGYHDEMQDFLDANPGLRSRFSRIIDFPDYSADNLVEIISNRAKKLDYSFEEDAVEYIRDYFTRLLSNPPENFGNARFARNYLDNAIHRQANRLISETDLDADKLMTLKLEDLKGKQE